MICPTCEGKGFIEYEVGLITVQCETCMGAKEIDDDNAPILSYQYETEGGDLIGVSYTHPQRVNPFSEEEIQRAYEILGPGNWNEESIKEALEHDGSSRTEPDNHPIGGGDTGQPKQSQKPKAKKKARARAK